jgi:hypothetical protein
MRNDPTIPMKLQKWILNRLTDIHLTIPRLSTPRVLNADFFLKSRYGESDVLFTKAA